MEERSEGRYYDIWRSEVIESINIKILCGDDNMLLVDIFSYLGSRGWFDEYLVGVNSIFIGEL